jgi:prolyl 4-hydroxylase
MKMHFNNRLSFFLANSEMDYGEDIGVRQDVEIDLEQFEDMQDVLYFAREYLTAYDFSQHANHPSLKNECRNKHELCALWAALGECGKNQLFMNATCAPVCHACQYLLHEVRCPLDSNAVDAWHPGDLNQMFERITNDPQYGQYQPAVLSRPDLKPGDTEQMATYKLGPWILVLDDFVSVSEGEQLIAQSTEGWNERPDTITLDLDGSNRTHCEGPCHASPTTRSVLQRLEVLTGIPQANYEHLHMIRFDPGYYPPHKHDHDFISKENKRQQGVRILNAFLFLNDVERGGGIGFPTLELNITAQRGRAVIWPLVLNEDPNTSDNRTSHQGLPLYYGTKYGAWQILLLSNVLVIFPKALAYRCLLFYSFSRSGACICPSARFSNPSCQSLPLALDYSLCESLIRTDATRMSSPPALELSWKVLVLRTE